MKGPSLYASTNRKGGIDKTDTSRADGRATSSPFQQKVQKGGEGQDQDKIFNKKGEHVGSWVNGKKVMKSTESAHGQSNDAQREFEADLLAAKKTKKKAPLKQTDEDVNLGKMTGLGPSTKFGGVKNPELIKKKKPKKQKKVMKDGPKIQVHGAGDTGNWQPHQFRKK